MDSLQKWGHFDKMGMKRTDLELYLKNSRRERCGIYGTSALGMAVAQTLLQSGAFSELLLCDASRQSARRAATALASALPFWSPADIYAAEAEDLCDCGVLILADASSVSADRLSAIAASGDRKNLIICAATPMNELTERLYRCSGLSHGRVFGIGGVTENLHLKQMVARHLCVGSDAVHVLLLGDEPLWNHANVAGIPLGAYCEMCGRGYDVGVLDGLFRTAHKKSGQSHSGIYAAAEAVRCVCFAVLRDASIPLSLTCPLEGHYGLQNVSLVVPCVLGRTGVRRILELAPEADAEKRLHALRPIQVL